MVYLGVVAVFWIVDIDIVIILSGAALKGYKMQLIHKAGWLTISGENEAFLGYFVVRPEVVRNHLLGIRWKLRSLLLVFLVLELFHRHWIAATLLLLLLLRSIPFVGCNCLIVFEQVLWRLISLLKDGQLLAEPLADIIAGCLLLLDCLTIFLFLFRDDAGFKLCDISHLLA